MTTSLAPDTLVRGAAIGAVAGAGATLAMSVVMVASERAGIMGEQPPERIVERGMRATGVQPDARSVDAAAAMAHVGFGIAGGFVFGLIAATLPRTTSHLVAVPWALVIWLVSYFGWIPALRILPPPTEDRPGRAWTLLFAHLVYGATLGALWRWISSASATRVAEVLPR